MTVNITMYNNILLYTFNAQAVNHLSPYVGFRLLPLQEHGVEHLLLHTYSIQIYTKFYVYPYAFKNCHNIGLKQGLKRKFTLYM